MLLLRFNVKLFVKGLAYRDILSFCPTKLITVVFVRETAPGNILSGGGVETKQHTAGKAGESQIGFTQYL